MFSVAKYQLYSAKFRTCQCFTIYFDTPLLVLGRGRGGSGIPTDPTTAHRNTQHGRFAMGKLCSACHEDLSKSKFSRRQWTAEQTQRRCKECSAHNLPSVPFPENREEDAGAAPSGAETRYGPGKQKRTCRRLMACAISLMAWANSV